MSDLTQNAISRLGVIDIGSNSVRLVIYELFGAHFTPVYNEKILAGLGRDLSQTSQLSIGGKEATMNALKRFKVIIGAHKLNKVLIGATAALRVASDAKAFINDIKLETGFEIKPLSGEEEARLTAMGLVASQPWANGLALDLGGASLELVEVHKGHSEKGISLPLGPFEVIGNDLSAFKGSVLSQAVSKHLDTVNLKRFRGRNLYLIGGAWRNLAAIQQMKTHYPLRTLQSYELTSEEALTLCKWAYQDGRAQVLNWPGLRKRRAETLPYSGYLLYHLISGIDPCKVIISQTGLREGLVYDHLSETLKNRDSLLDGCRDLARGNLQAIHFGQPLYNFLETAAENFPISFGAKNEKRLRRAACYLAGIGKGLHPDFRAELVFDDVLYAPIAALTHKERVYLAQILYSSYTTKKQSEDRMAVINLLTQEEQNSAKIYGTAMRVGIVASGRSAHILSSLTLSLEDDVIRLKSAPEYSALYTSRVQYRLKKLAQIAGFKFKA